MENCVTKEYCLEHQKTDDAEHKGLEAEDGRQNERITAIEGQLSSIKELAISVNTLATSIQHMSETMKSQTNRIDIHSKRLDALEKKDGDMWQSIVKTVVGGVAMLIAGYLFAKLTGG